MATGQTHAATASTKKTKAAKRKRAANKAAPVKRAGPDLSSVFSRLRTQTMKTPYELVRPLP